MMRCALAAAVLAASLAGPSGAQGLPGEWQFQRQGYNGLYSGAMVVDERGQVRLKGRGPDYAYVECGYVRTTQETTEFVFTFAKGEVPYSPDHFHCLASGERAFVCYNADAAGHREPATFTVARTGDVPDSPAGRLEGICPVQERPLSHARPRWNFG